MKIRESYFVGALALCGVLLLVLSGMMQYSKTERTYGWEEKTIFVQGENWKEITTWLDMEPGAESRLGVTFAEAIRTGEVRSLEEESWGRQVEISIVPVEDLQIPGRKGQTLVDMRAVDD